MKCASLVVVCVALYMLLGDRGGAAVVVTDPPDPIAIQASFPAEPFDLNDDGVVELSLRISGVQSWADSFQSNRIVGTELLIGFFYAFAHPQGSLIGASPTGRAEWRLEQLTMSACAMGVCNGLFVGGIDYLGIEFDILGETHYGWLEIESASQFTRVIVHRWAYETEPGVGIVAGIPEPSTGVLLVAAAAVAVLRRRR